jgi:PKD repeat protein
MNQAKTLTFLVVLMCLSNLLFSQKHIGNFDQLLVTGTKTPVENFNTFLISPEIARNEIIQNQFYRLIQFFEIPTELEKRIIEEAGIQLFDYLPHQTYVASIPTNFSKEKIRDLSIRSVTKLEAIQKITPSIFSDEKVLLQYYPNLSPTFVQQFLQNKNIEVHEFFQEINAVVICNNSNLMAIANFPISFFISPTDLQNSPEYIPGRNIHRSNSLTPQIAGYPQFNGEGINIAIGDDGMIESHIDFKNRTNQDDVQGDSEGSHGEMVAGILAGAGNLDPRMEGTASHAEIHMFHEFDAVKRASTLYNNRDILITSTSYSDGCNRGYTYLAQLADHQIKNNISLMHVFSAGNTGHEDCGYGAGAGWGNITGGVKMGKNVLTVANVDTDDQLSPTSSRGPANDGRIKPDISANGDGQISTQPNNTYAAANGSSAAAPGVAGVLAQLYDSFEDVHPNTFPNSALVKSIILNTADDLGNPGPDYSYGFGRINARRALNVLQNEQYFEGILGHANTHSYFVSVPEGTQQLRVMLYWNDYEGSTISSPSLVNDLDLRVTNNSNQNYLPWVLNSSPDSNLLNLPAVRGIDHLNNVEQVTIDLPESGLFSFFVEGSIIPQGIQPYFLVYEFIQNDITLTYPLGGEKLVAGETEKIHWDAFGNFSNFEIEVSYNNGLTWSLINLVSGEKRSTLWQVPEVTCNQAKIRVKRNNQESVCLAPFSIYEVPQNVHIAEVCPDMVRIEWEPVANANTYLIYKLGEKFMEVFSSSNMPFFEIPIDNPSEENWYAVAAIRENGLEGRRSFAISDGTDLLNCDLGTDVSIVNIATPANSITQSCFQNAMTVSINIKNTGSAFQSNIPVFYQFDNLPAVAELYNSSIPPGVTINYIFNQKITAATIGNHQLKVWTSLLNDQATFNDSMKFELEVVPSTASTVPYFQNFDNLQNCDPKAVCDAPCTLASGWYNDPNHLSDDIDWLVHQGATPTAGTGPDYDQNTNTVNGKYLYLESSRGCVNQEAYLLSPCFYLSNVSQPVFSFWYHMKGANTGRLHIDVFDGSNWFYNITSTFSGEQGNDWQEAEIDLSAFSNKIINIRFRGVTGNDFLTDIAIDNISLFDAHSEPYPSFKANKLFTCPQQKVQFIDNSINTPTMWEWSFSPNTITYLDGTSASSANPAVTFNEEGSYDITLIVSNNYGFTQITKHEYIQISKGRSIPLGDNFDSAILDLEKWATRNDDNSTTWESTPTIGRDGKQTRAVFMNNHSYNATGKKDELHSVVIDLTAAEQPFLRFDWSYAQFNSNFSDGLEVILSTDCGEHFEEVIFEKDGEELATVPDQISAWFPQESYHWKTAKIDLSNFIGSSVAIRFVNRNGFGNNLFLDNFLAYERSNYPDASLIFYPEENTNTFCVGQEAITFLTNSNAENEFFWNFGATANPTSSEEYGPHVVTFMETGTYHISLRVLNGWGYDMAETEIHIIDAPVADFDYSITNNIATFTNHSLFGDAYMWEFGDGTTSSLPAPTHQYQPGDTYLAQLTVSNICGKSTTQQTLIILTDTKDLKNIFFINAYPNPSDDFILFEMPALNHSSIPLEIIDTRGTTVSSLKIKEANGLFTQRLNISELAQGMYFARVRIEGQFFVKRFVKVL